MFRAPARAMHGIVHAKWVRSVSIVLALLVALLAVAAAATPLLVRRWVVPTMNAHLQDYAMRVGSARLRPLRAGLAFADLTIEQHKKRDGGQGGPLATVPRLLAGLDVPGLLHGHFGLVVRLDSAALNLDSERVAVEWHDRVLIFDKGWIEAFNAISPLPINRLYANDASVTYVHRPNDPPLRITGATLAATDLARDGEAGTFPSRVRMSPILPGGGQVRMEGAANVTNPKRPTIDADFGMQGARLDAVQPVLRPMHVTVTNGTADAEGHLTLTWEHQRVHTRRMQVDGLVADYVQTQAAPRLEKLVGVADELARRPLDLTIDELVVRNATVGFVDETSDPDYRIAMTRSQLTLSSFSSERQAHARLVATGAVMSSGTTRVEATFPARWRQPEGTLTVRMRDVQIRRLNDALRGFAGLDVTRGRLSLDAALKLDGRVLRGRIQPRITDVEVHDSSQDAGEGILQHTYEAVVGAVTGIFAGKDDTASVDAAFDIEPAPVDTWGEALYALRKAGAHKLRTVLHVATSDPLADGE